MEELTMYELIVNADDFGLTKEINDGIIDAHLNGIVTSTTVMVNGNALEDAIIKIKKYKKLGIGLHFNLTEGKSLTTNETLTDLNGYFNIKNIRNNNLDKEEIKAELEAQYNILKQNNIKIYHIDCHHHVFTNKKVKEVVENFSKKKNIFIRKIEKRNIIAIIEKLFENINLRSKIIKKIWKKLSYSDEKSMSTDLFFGRFYGVGATEDLLVKILLSNRKKSLEIMVHPGYFFENDDYKYREKELQILKNRELKKFIEKENISLTTYKKLKEEEIYEL
jgi:predicted glycoside hydrolase/deacetylase ChbG (UPF0249 family)